MKLTLCQPAEGANTGDEVDVPADRGRFLLMEGYATTADGNPPAEHRHGPSHLDASRRTDDGGTADNADPDDGTDGPPARSAVKADWVAYAVAQGATEDEADNATKDDLIARYAG